MLVTEISTEISNNDYKKLAAMIYDYCGIRLPEEKKSMVEGRIKKRLREKNYNRVKDYLNYVNTEEGRAEEFDELVNVLTTNKTDFFREEPHFEFLKSTVIPEFAESGKPVFELWSSACSTGEEPYSLAILLDELRNSFKMDYSITASDISTIVLNKARLGIYTNTDIEGIPEPLRKKYLLKSKTREADIVRIVPEIRKKINFRRINLMDNAFPFDRKFDCIFCRNVLIYFDRKTQERVINKLADYLNPGGYLFLGHSETISGMSINLARAAATVYRKA